MKWVALLVFILVGIGFTIALQRDKRAALAVAFLLGFLPFVIAPWNLMVAPYEMAAWPGYVKGWEFGLIDALAIAVLLGLPKGHSPTRFKYLFLLYIASTLLSVFLAPNFKIALSYPIQLTRVFLIFLAVARVSAVPDGLKAVVQGLVIGLAYQAIAAIVAKSGGAVQTGGSFGHQNMLGFVSHLVFLPAFGLLLSGQWTRWAVLGLISGTIVVILTASRATIVFAAIGLIITYVVSASSQWTTRKGLVGLASVAAITLALPVTQSAFQKRFEERGGSFTEQDEERAAFKKAAFMMIADSPFGVGANHYVVEANTRGYSQRAGVAWNTGSRATNVHNSFLLIWAETGFLGLFAIVAMLTTIIWTCFTYAIALRGSSSSGLMLGLATGLGIMSLHALYEWVLVVYNAQYVLAVAIGLSAGLIQQYNKASQVRRQKDLSVEPCTTPFIAPAQSTPITK